jgi:AraC-like DNA-binding protein
MATASLPQAERFDFWRELVAHETAPAQIYSDHLDNFDAWARITDLGSVRLTSFRYPSLEMRRTEQLIRRSDPEVYQLAVPTAGRSTIMQARRQSALQPADLTIIDTSRPHEAAHLPNPSGRRYVSSITLQIPHAALPLPAGKVDKLLATRLPSGEGVAALLAQYLRQLAEHPERYRTADAKHLGNIALDLLAATLAQQLDVQSALPGDVQHNALRARVYAFIEENLGDPTLSPPMIAAAHHVSTRTLHRLFASDETTVAEVIRTRRLRHCRRDLDNPLLRGQPVYVIAARWGFLDKAHFSRLFRTAYGMGPQAYRAESRLPD